MKPTNQPMLKAGFHKNEAIWWLTANKKDREEIPKWGNKQLISKNQSSI